MGKRNRFFVLLVFFFLLVSLEAIIAQAQGVLENYKQGEGNGNGNDKNGNGKGKGDEQGNGNKGKEKKKEKKPPKPPKDPATDYKRLSSVPKTGQERAFCQAQGACYYKTLACPPECPKRKPKKKQE